MHGKADARAGVAKAAAADLEQISNYLREHHPRYRQPTKGLHSGLCAAHRLFAWAPSRAHTFYLRGLQVEPTPERV